MSPTRALPPLALLALSACSGAGPTPGAGGPVISASPGWVRQTDASVAAAPDGRVAVVWIDVDASGFSGVGYAFSTDDGRSFGPPSVLVSPMGRIASDPTVAVDATGSFFAAWVGYRVDGLGDASDMHVYAAGAPAGSSAFGPPVEVSDPAEAPLYDKPWIKASPAGGLVVTYQREATPLDVGIVMARSADGTAWQRAFVADDPAGAVFRNLAFVCAPGEGERLWVTYVAGETTFDVRLAYSDDGGATWSPETVVSAPSEPVAFDDPSCVADAAGVWVAYGLTGDTVPFSPSHVSKLDAIRLARSDGQTVAARLDAQDPLAGAYFMHPQIAGEGGGAVDLVYYAGAADQDPSGSFRRSRAASPAGGFSPSVVVDTPIVFLQARADPRWVGDYAGLFVRGSELYTAFAVNESGLAHVAFAETKVP